MYIKITNGVPEKYTIGQFRRDNPNVSYPKTIPLSFLAEQDVYPLTETNKPSFDILTQNCVEGTPEYVNGAWLKTWVVENRPQEEAEARIRSRRNDLISETDWRVLPDQTPSQAWLDYRQALRDVTDQEGFPYSVTWPIDPDTTSPLTT